MALVKVAQRSSLVKAEQVPKGSKDWSKGHGSRLLESFNFLGPAYNTPAYNMYSMTTEVDTDRLINRLLDVQDIVKTIGKVIPRHARQRNRSEDRFVSMEYRYTTSLLRQARGNSRPVELDREDTNVDVDENEDEDEDDRGMEKETRMPRPPFTKRATPSTLSCHHNLLWEPQDDTSRSHVPSRPTLQHFGQLTKGERRPPPDVRRPPLRPPSALATLGASGARKASTHRTEKPFKSIDNGGVKAASKHLSPGWGGTMGLVKNGIEDRRGERNRSMKRMAENGTAFTGRG
ncbi:hypothetical protein K504DRAFT_506388 [Pleomassaria siparia CBS 279.74]|uniref:Uncharacterized protein n=1 Tax=Pleomassaria siparia CBS 279.74 TaxID=1314801 RepID=A0A6G1JXD1_9PLEO|nr:hypothetical protein K504DRAFT_506388 [Pleomassaria siparia CBS 279.74]